MKNQKSLFSLVLIIHLLLISCNEKAKPDKHNCFSKEFVDQHNGYSEVVVISTCETKTLYISGQIGDGPDLESQMRSAIEKLQQLLGKMNAGTRDIVKMNTYIVDYDGSQLQLFRNVRKELLGDEKMPASTLVGVHSLARKEWLIEIEAIAVLPVQSSVEYTY